jgi:BirA family transcriptional regulator, biotin operon repressor / biotin---[acetyl-CoA-carboxylase] ligase
VVAADSIDPDELRRELVRPGGLWRQVDYVAETGSTNADLATAARAGAEPGCVLVTDHQSAGRGRMGRTWTAPPGTSIAMSVLVRPDGVDPARWTWLPLLAGLAVSDGLSRAAGLAVRLKWPNDVLVGDRKLCGILAERVDTSGRPACVVGMGINTHLTAEDLPVPTATSVAIECAVTGRPTPSRTAVIATVLAAFELLFRRWTAAPDDAWLAAAYRRRSATLGRNVRVLLGPDESVEGVATDVDGDGRLVVQTPDALRIFGAGDVVHVR